jgi:ribosome-associated translation inhibitor RaiA
MAVHEAGLVQVRTTGAIPEGSPELAERRVAALLRHVGEPVLFARVMLALSPDPAVEQPATAWATVSVNGRQVRAHATGETMSAAIGLLTDRLRLRLDRAWPEQRPRTRRGQPGLRKLRHRP